MTNLGEKTGAGTPAFPFPTADNHDAHATPASAPKVEHPTEEALDHGIKESFPASDPVPVSVTAKLPVAPAPATTALPVATAVAPMFPGRRRAARLAGHRREPVAGMRRQRTHRRRHYLSGLRGHGQRQRRDRRWLTG
ncbi:MAG TPA: hypothetical protein VMR43_05100 [Variovorax sp.]|nr:hypothetical protein [Variovorax sp.]